MSDIKGQASYWEDPENANRYKKAEAWTTPPGRRLVDASGLRTDDRKEPLSVLDNCCGTGVITALLHEMLPKPTVENMKLTCSDLSPVMLEANKQRIQGNGWKAETKIVDAQKMNLPDSTFDYVFTSFGLLALPDGKPALSEIHRILKTSGINALSTWKTVAWMADTEAALASIPDAPRLPPGETLFSITGAANWDSPDWLVDQLRAAGFTDIRTEIVPNPCRVDNAEELMGNVMPLLENMCLKAMWSKEEIERFGPQVRPRLQEYLEGKYGVGKSFVVEMEACVAVGRKEA